MAEFSNWKPAKGTAYTERRKKVDGRHRAEQDEMTATKRRDGYKCRFPKCRNKTMTVECAHFDHRGPGGNPAGDRTRIDTMITLCIAHHGQFDRHDMDIMPLTERGTNGPCEFRWRVERSGPMTHYAVERTFSVSETRS